MEWAATIPRSGPWSFNQPGQKAQIACFEPSEVSRGNDEQD